jgi:hypothetical protein
MRSIITVTSVAAATVLIVASNAVPAGARDDGRYAGSPLKSWFDQLASTKGLCCSFADGVTIEDVDWDTGGAKGGYRVRLGGEWIDVPEAALVKEPNKFGPAVVWPYRDVDGVTQIRCFLPGAGT